MSAVKYTERELGKILHGMDGPLRWALGENSELVTLALVDGGTRFLDLGAGSGYITLELAQRVQSSAQIISADVSPDLMKVLLEKANTLGIASRIETVICDVREMPFEDASFDAIVSSYLLHEVDELSIVFSEVYRILKPGGRFVFSDFCRLSDVTRTKNIESWYAKTDPEGHQDVHLRYSTDEILEALEDVGYSRKWVRPWLEFHMRGVAKK
ncbi:MAG: class I SAM-dependent methyltransferase [Thermoleophilia bacterium]